MTHVSTSGYLDNSPRLAAAQMPPISSTRVNSGMLGNKEGGHCYRQRHTGARRYRCRVPAHTCGLTPHTQRQERVIPVQDAGERAGGMHASWRLDLVLGAQVHSLCRNSLSRGPMIRVLVCMDYTSVNVLKLKRCSFTCQEHRYPAQ